MGKIIAALIGLCLGMVTLGMAATTASAAQAAASPAISLQDLNSRLSPVTKAGEDYGYRHYCVRQYFKCRDRWGDSGGFRGCMQWRGCWEAYLDYRARHSHYGGCSRWKEACAENWGHGNEDYYGCLRYHGCGD
jgi:hypothetical protein